MEINEDFILRVIGWAIAFTGATLLKPFVTNGWVLFYIILIAIGSIMFTIGLMIRSLK